MKHLELLILLVAGLLLTYAEAHADGVFFSKDPSSIEEPEQEAVLIYDKGVEQLALKVAYKGAKSDFVWIVPCPAKPEVSTIDHKFFEAIGNMHAGFRKDDYNGSALKNFAMGNMDNAPIVHERKIVGPYEMTVLSGVSGLSISEWLQSNGYHHDNHARPILADYANKGWFFVAAKLASGDATEAGVEPLTFSTPEPVYPLAISGANPGKSRIVLFVLGAGSAKIRNGNRFQSVFSDWVGKESIDSSQFFRDLEWRFQRNQPGFEEKFHSGVNELISRENVRMDESIKFQSELTSKIFGRMLEKVEPGDHAGRGEKEKRLLDEKRSELESAEDYYRQQVDISPASKMELSREHEDSIVRIEAHYAAEIEQLRSAPLSRDEIKARHYQMLLEQQKKAIEMPGVQQQRYNEKFRTSMEKQLQRPAHPLGEKEKQAHSLLKQIQERMYFLTRFQAEFTAEEMTDDVWIQFGHP